MDSLRELPLGATYRSKSGQATATVSMKGNTVVVYAECDSLQQLVYNLEEQLSSVSMHQERKEIIRTPAPMSFKTKAKCFFYGVITGLFIMIFIITTRKYGTHSR